MSEDQRKKSGHTLSGALEEEIEHDLKSACTSRLGSNLLGFLTIGSGSQAENHIRSKLLTTGQSLYGLHLWLMMAVP